MFATISRITDRQHGRISCEQLQAAGVDRNRVARWIADGWLRRVHTGVYAVGHAAGSVDGDFVGAVLAGGAGAVLGHRAAAYKFGLIRTAPQKPEVTVPTNAHRRRPRIVIHRVKALDRRDVTKLDDIPITTVPRVLLDLAPRTTRQSSRGCATRGGSGTALEDAFLKLLDAHDLPRPRTNIDEHGDKVDCHWPDHDLTVEIITYRYHASRHAFEQDVARRRRSSHIAYTYGDISERGAQTIADLRPRLRRQAGVDGSGL